jgi:hypothetical protein
MKAISLGPSSTCMELVVFEPPESLTNEFSNAAQEFTQFPQLPPEIRDMIWKWALPGPRAVRIQNRGTNSKVEDVVEAMANLHLKPQDPVCKIPLSTHVLGLGRLH